MFIVNIFNISFAGKYACQITPRSHLPRQEISVLDTSVRLYVTVSPQKGQPELRPAPISLPFLPPIFTHNAEIHLSTLTPLSSLRISAVSSLSDQIQVCFLQVTYGRLYISEFSYCPLPFRRKARGHSIGLPVIA